MAARISSSCALGLLEEEDDGALEELDDGEEEDGGALEELDDAGAEDDDAGADTEWLEELECGTEEDVPDEVVAGGGTG